MSATVEHRTSTAAEFVAAFEEGWSHGATDKERFLELLQWRFADDARLVQPLSRTFRGPEGLREMADSLFAAIPDLRGETLRWGETEDGVMIELRLYGTYGGRPLEWVTLDRIVMRDGQVVERRAYFDPAPVVVAMLLRPLTTLKLLPSLLGAGGGARRRGGRKS
jgi:ketosteroid isomerase-like protein